MQPKQTLKSLLWRLFGTHALADKVERLDQEVQSTHEAVKRLSEIIGHHISRSSPVDTPAHSSNDHNNSSVTLANSLEVEKCREIAADMIFVFGFARSNTSILTNCLNTDADTLILAESYFFMRKKDKNFQDWFNKQHISFANQITKTSYAPNFVADRAHDWLDWLFEARKFYNRLGEKVAFSHFHFARVPPAEVREFFEARFFHSKHVFTIRDPVQTLISLAKLRKKSDSTSVKNELTAWLDFIQFWADFIRTFPHTITLIAEKFDKNAINELENFLSIDLSAAHHLLSDEEKQFHQTGKSGSIVADYSDELNSLYDAVKAAISHNETFQATQKRTLLGNDTRYSNTAPTRVAPRPLGQVWVMAEELKERVQSA